MCAERGSRPSWLAVVFLFTATAALAWLVSFPGAAVGQGSTVLVTRVDGTITPVIADHLVDGVAAAERGGHAGYLVELDTPGGLDASMREIIKAFLGAEVPVVVYVTPSGARAASAGALITFAAHVAAMAPGTTIGAATPVDLQGGEISDKVLNDAAANQAHAPRSSPRAGSAFSSRARRNTVASCAAGASTRSRFADREARRGRRLRQSAR